MSLFLDLLFPKSCYVCKKNGSYLCRECQTNLTTLSLKENRLSLFKYRFPIKEMIHDLKYQYLTDLIPTITKISLDNIQQNYPNLLSYWQENQFTLIPIPLHWYRQNWRGFNQSELLASQISKSLNLSYDPNLLIRSKHTPPQVKTKNKKLRTANISSAFSLNPNHYPLDTNHLILFDDVYTTGSTLNSAASVFPKNTDIWFLTLAG